jgi:hypothetical protein
MKKLNYILTLFLFVNIIIIGGLTGNALRAEVLSPLIEVEDCICPPNGGGGPALLGGGGTIVGPKCILRAGMEVCIIVDPETGQQTSLSGNGPFCQEWDVPSTCDCDDEVSVCPEEAA